MLRIKIDYPFDTYTMFKEAIAGILGPGGSYDLDVNQTGTKVTVQDLSGGGSNNLTIIGTGLTVFFQSGYYLGGGHVSGFGYHYEGNAHVAQADISGLNLDATALEGLIDGATSVVQLQDELFDNRPQKIIGSPFGDYIQGGHKADKIYGHGGGDYIFASQGNDIVHGNAGLDTLNFIRLPNSLGGVTLDLSAHTASFGTFHQMIYGFEYIFLTSHADKVTGTSRAESIVGGADNDIISSMGGKDTIFGGDGKDVIHGGLGKDSINGGAKNDKLFGGSNADAIHGGGGNDTINGGSAADQLHGEAGRDRIFGDTGRDHIYGQAGNDVLKGGGGPDDVYGGPGEDVIRDGFGNDYYSGGGSADTFHFHNSKSYMGKDEISDFTNIDSVIIHDETVGGVRLDISDADAHTIDYGEASNVIVFDNVDVNHLSITQDGADVLVVLV